jgi:hypothetical protein
MPLRADSKYPSSRAYVVKLQGDATPRALAGRIENLVTGRQLEFTSGGELLDSIARDLRDHVSEQSVAPSGEER